jgi:hypothetical protein
MLAIGARSAAADTITIMSGFLQMGVDAGQLPTINLSANPAALSVWTVDSVRYDFSAAKPVPEPGTMLLVGLGIAAAARRLRRR